MFGLRPPWPCPTLLWLGPLAWGLLSQDHKLPDPSSDHAFMVLGPLAPCSGPHGLWATGPLVLPLLVLGLCPQSLLSLTPWQALGLHPQCRVYFAPGQTQGLHPQCLQFVATVLLSTTTPRIWGAPRHCSQRFLLSLQPQSVLGYKQKPKT